MAEELFSGRCVPSAVTSPPTAHTGTSCFSQAPASAAISTADSVFP